MEIALRGVRVAPARMIPFLLGVLSFSFLENQSHREVEAESCEFRCL